MKLVAESFAWPFRTRGRSSWALGLIAVLLLPLLFIPLLGYAVAATRAAEDDPSAGPPPWHLGLRLLSDGVWTSIAVLVMVLPFALLLNPLAGLLRSTSLQEPYAHVVALFILALPWGVVALLHMPHATARFAAGGRPSDLIDVRASLRGVRQDFVTWNVAAAAIVTGWAVGLACVGLVCVGIVPGIFYAILVSAHASATLHHPDSRPPAGRHRAPR
ncbi:MAG TPA: DUF4013 domain-containing protein [Candidatus Dormibacteraeota bacterium]|nr:DUF4013 domain-containing protein [Candidatus Dormibacteraeota bacterium]